MNLRQKTFCTVFPNYRDFHFYKDPGQIPYRFSKLGYNAYLVCYGKGKEYNDSEKYLRIKKLRDNYLLRKFNAGMVFFLLFNSRKIDVLNTFHLTWNSLFFVFIYKICNRAGFAYLKLDDCALAGVSQWETDYKKPGMNGCRQTDLKRRLKNRIARTFLLQKVDLWSIEDEYSKEIYEARYDFFKEKLITVYNGHTSDLPGSMGAGDIADKEEIILTAGRLGTYQKATEILLEAFKPVAAHTSFSLHLAGRVEPAFNDYIDKYLKANPHLTDRVVFHGSLGRDELYRLYRRSSIFCMPSRFEGMAVVFPEAMYYRNVVVTTKDGSLKYLIDRYNIGLMVDKEDDSDLADALVRLIDNRELRDEMAQNAHEISSTLLNWDNIARTLQAEIECRMGGSEG
jgi:glycosyltransferase involved in cell wall biosynthesis